MKIPRELEHLIRASSRDQSPLSPLPATSSLSTHLSTIESRKALEVEHYLRACAMRLDLDDS